MPNKTYSFDYFLGIDFSKQTLDLSLLNAAGEAVCKPFQVANSVEGYDQLVCKLERVKALSPRHEIGQLKACLLIVGENTGRYSQLISHLFVRDQWSFWLENPLEIKLSSGVTRGKTDVADAYRIALYGMRHQDAFSPYQPSSKTLLHLDALLKQHDKVKRLRKSYVLSSKSIGATLEEFGIEQNATVVESHQTLIASFDQHMEALESKMEMLIEADVELKKQTRLLMSIPGIGIQTARAMIVYTCGFTRLISAANFKSYCGVAPFEYQSGSSVRWRTKVHPNANKHLKSLLHMCAMRVLRLEGELQDYYHRKVAEGKNKMLVINNLRAKLIDRIVAVIKRGTPYKNAITA